MLGGLAVVLAVVSVLGLIQVAGIAGLHPLDPPLFLALTLGVVPVLFVSIWDDFRPLPVLPRLAAHVAGAAIALLFGIRLGVHVHLFAVEVSIGVFAIPLSLLWIVGVTNAFNIVDGLDGLSAGLALIAALSLVGVSLMTNTFAMASASIVLAGALVGFLPFNLFPARVFLGDSGATALGFWLSCLALGGGSTLSAGMAILVPILVVGVPVAETLVSLSRRLVRQLEKRGGGVFGADGEHMHHRLISRGVTHRRAVMLLYGAGVLGAGAGLASVFLTVRAAAILLLTLIAAAVIGITRLNYDEFALVRRGVLLELYDVPVLQRALFPVFFDLGLVVLSLYGGIGLTFGDWGIRTQRPLALELLEILPFVTIGVFWLLGMYRGPWSHANAKDFLRSIAAVLTSSAAGGLMCLVAIRNPPPAFFATQTLILLLLVNGTRGLRALFGRFGFSPNAGVRPRPGDETPGGLPSVPAKASAGTPAPPVGRERTRDAKRGALRDSIGLPGSRFLSRLLATGYSKAMPRLKWLINRHRSPQAVFTEVYERGSWGGMPGEFYSGSGTHEEEIVSAYVSGVSRTADVRGFGGRTFVDLGCGDFHVGQRLLPLCSRYVGVDVVKPLVARNERVFGNETTRFVHADIIEEDLPGGDVGILRHVLQHLSNRQIRAILDKLRIYRWVLITEHYPTDNDAIVPNRDMVHGGYVRVHKNSGVYLSEPPFDLPKAALTLVLETPATDLGGDRDRGVVRTFLYEPGGNAHR